MDFDMGGFLGNIIGVIGAYGVAKWTFKREDERRKKEALLKKPAENRATMEYLQKIRDQFQLASDELANRQTDDEFFGIFKRLLIDPLDKLLPEIVENAPILYKAVSKCVKKYEEIYYSVEKGDKTKLRQDALGNIMAHLFLFLGALQSMDNENEQLINELQKIST